MVVVAIATAGDDVGTNLVKAFHGRRSLAPMVFA